MRISDWSSDVCSSDLPRGGAQARLPRPGIQPRSQHALLQGLRRGTHRDRPRPQAGDRPVARAGPEYRIATDLDHERQSPAYRYRPPWPDAGAIVTFGCRHDNDLAPPGGDGPPPERKTGRAHV